MFVYEAINRGRVGGPPTTRCARRHGRRTTTAGSSYPDTSRRDYTDVPRQVMRRFRVMVEATADYWDDPVSVLAFNTEGATDPGPL